MYSSPVSGRVADAVCFWSCNAVPPLLCAPTTYYGRPRRGSGQAVLSRVGERRAGGRGEACLALSVGGLQLWGAGVGAGAAAAPSRPRSQRAPTMQTRPP